MCAGVLNNLRLRNSSEITSEWTFWAFQKIFCNSQLFQLVPQLIQLPFTFISMSHAHLSDVFWHVQRQNGLKAGAWGEESKLANYLWWCCRKALGSKAPKMSWNSPSIFIIITFFSPSFSPGHSVLINISNISTSTLLSFYGICVRNEKSFSSLSSSSSFGFLLVSQGKQKWHKSGSRWAERFEFSTN